MAKRPAGKKVRTKSKSRKKPGLILRIWQLGALVVLAAIVYAAWLWIDMQSWRPAEETYPEQGALIASGSDTVRFETLKAIGAQFVYLELAGVSGEPDPLFGARLEAARAAGLKVGIVLPFDPCRRADPHSERFTRMVPRDADLLPPAIALVEVPIACEEQVFDASVTSEVLTLVNQVEGHSGKPAILKLGDAFEMKYRLAGRMERDLWLIRDRARPRYAGRPWLLWSANSQLETQASAQPVEWVVVQR
ncbi:MAG: glycoside hydrolase family 25 protein [Pseudomonadota bacterium]